MPQCRTVLLVEDDWAVRSAVRGYLGRHEIAVCEADCFEAALSVAATALPDVAIVDMVLPERAGERPDFDRHLGIEVARRLHERLPDMGIVFLSAYADLGPEVVQLFMGGQDRIAYLLKGSKPEVLLEAVHRVASGLSGLEIASGMRTARRTAFDLMLGTLSEAERATVCAALDNLATLSDPERRVFDVVGACRTRQQAADELALSAKTISSHVDAVYDKLGLREAHPGLNPLALLAKIHLLAALREAERVEPS
jgi:two-component system response regulator DevR